MADAMKAADALFAQFTRCSIIPREFIRVTMNCFTVAIGCLAFPLEWKFYALVHIPIEFIEPNDVFFRHSLISFPVPKL